MAGHDADGLEQPVAFVIRDPGASVTEPELVEHCRQGPPFFERPRTVVFVDSYRITATAKIRRVELRQQAGTG